MEGILDQFPTVQHAFAYGSGVFKQPGLYDDKTHPSEGPMIDLMFAVDNPVAWHRENIANHSSHYSRLRWLGPQTINWVADSVGAGVYFNTLVPWGQGVIKYGVVNLGTLQRDLIYWDTFYLAGRMQKPVQTLASNAAVEEAQALNLESALRVSLILLEEEKFSLRHLLRMICGLSYEGDVRMGVAEDCRKVERIVQGSYAGLVDLYTPTLATAEREWKVLERNGDYLTQDCSPTARAPLLAALPAAMLAKLGASVGRNVPAEFLSDPAARAKLASDLAGFSQCGKMLRRCLAQTVRASSAKQAVAGALSAGAIKSARYAWRKFRKGSNENRTLRFLEKAGM